MGPYLAKMPKSADMPSSITPKSGDMAWIIHNAAACAMSPVEVHRMWMRFKQLGSTTDGTLIVQGAKINEFFSVRILQLLQNTKGEVPFKQFLAAAAWWSRCDIEDKLGVVFYLMNEHYSMNTQKLKEVLRKIHPNWDDYKVDDLAEAVIRELDLNKDGKIDLQEFTNWHVAHVEPTSRLLDFAILPPEVKVNDDKLPLAKMLGENDMFNRLQAELAKSSQSTPRDGNTNNNSAVNTSQSLVRGEPAGDHVLRAAAERLVGRDWMMLSNILNFTTSDVDAIASLYTPDQELQKILMILKTWRDRERVFATVDALDQALNQSGLRDVAAELRAFLA